MLRRLQVVSNKNADAGFKASVASVRGRLVQKDYTNGVVIVPTSQVGLYLVDKGQFPTGLMSLEGELSDYDTRYETINAGEYVVLETPLSGEKYGTNEYVSTGLVVGDYLEVETDAGANQGKLIKAAAATGLKFAGTTVDNGKTLAIVEVV